ncbi:MAG: hypothetical protein EZS28_003255 [Streblomastix strix]|uniref:SPRY domain-containing protein n=1 Tax=Streblomastix strix TaxID=222440 RepID=A0A5J4X1S8_9EUKA|nr:MAG: hypothetical protein EZS28_003255 [Streblomastix strix]
MKKSISKTSMTKEQLIINYQIYQINQTNQIYQTNQIQQIKTKELLKEKQMMEESAADLEKLTTGFIIEQRAKIDLSSSSEKQDDVDNIFGDPDGLFRISCALCLDSGFNLVVVYQDDWFINCDYEVKKEGDGGLSGVIPTSDLNQIHSYISSTVDHSVVSVLLCHVIYLMPMDLKIVLINWIIDQIEHFLNSMTNIKAFGVVGNCYQFIDWCSIIVASFAIIAIMEYQFDLPSLNWDYLQIVIIAKVAFIELMQPFTIVSITENLLEMGCCSESVEIEYYSNCPYIIEGEQQNLGRYPARVDLWHLRMYYYPCQLLQIGDYRHFETCLKKRLRNAKENYFCYKIMQKVKEEEEKTFRVPEIPVDIDEQKITELAVDLRSSNNNIHIFALHKLLTLILLIPNINGSIHQQDIIWTLKGFLTDGTKSELKEISIAILRLIGLRWGKHEYSIKGESIATLLIQIILLQILKKMNKQKQSPLNERIAELESRNHWLQQQIVVERTETERLSVELVADHEAYEQYQRQKEQERSQRLRNEGEIGRIRYEMKRKAVLAKRSQIILTEQQELNQTSVKFTIALPDSPYIHSNGSFTYTTNNYEQHKFQIDALLQDGIYRCNFKANNAAGISVGIIKGGFNFPLIGNPFYGPNNDKFSLFSQTGKVSFSNQISGGNAQFQSGDYITLEVNLKTHGTAHLFINGVQQNVYLSGIPLQIEFIFYLEGKNVSITVNSIKHLNIPTVKKLDNQRKIVWKED